MAAYTEHQRRILAYLRSPRVAGMDQAHAIAQALRDHIDWTDAEVRRLYRLATVLERASQQIQTAGTTGRGQAQGAKRVAVSAFLPPGSIQGGEVSINLRWQGTLQNGLPVSGSVTLNVDASATPALLLQRATDFLMSGQYTGPRLRYSFKTVRVTIGNISPYPRSRGVTLDVSSATSPYRR